MLRGTNCSLKTGNRFTVQGTTAHGRDPDSESGLAARATMAATRRIPGGDPPSPSAAVKTMAGRGYVGQGGDRRKRGILPNKPNPSWVLTLAYVIGPQFVMYRNATKWRVGLFCENGFVYSVPGPKKLVGPVKRGLFWRFCGGQECRWEGC